MTRQREAILLLLGSIDDHWPSLGTNFRPTRGLTAAKRVPCPDCGHTAARGWRVDSFKRRTPCVTCGGAVEPTGAHGQWLVRDGGKGVVRVDPMDADQAPVRTETQAAPPTRAPRLVACDACDGSGVRGARRCERCDGSGRRQVVTFAATPGDEKRADLGATLNAIRARDDAGDYHALDWALARLPRRYRRLVLTVHGPARSTAVEELTENEAKHLERALLLLDGAMPHKPRVPGYVRTAAKRKTSPKGAMTNPHQLALRDNEIRRLIRRGTPRQWVAREYGLSVSQTYAIAPSKSIAA